MAQFKSKFLELTFFVDGKPHKFSNGAFSTEDEAVIEKVENLRDAVRVDEVKEDKTEVKPKAKPKGKPKAEKPKADTSEE